MKPVNNELGNVPSKTSQFLTKWREAAYRDRLLHTIWLFLSFISMGFIAGQRGPSFLDLQLITETDTEQASFFFTAAAIGGLLGALVVGALYDKFNKIRLIFLTNIGMGLCVGVIPQCKQYYLMLTSWFFTGFCMRGLEAGGTADVVRVWKSESRPYMFIVHLGFSIGALISPLITEPFLVPKDSLVPIVRPTKHPYYLCQLQFETHNNSKYELTYNKSTFDPSLCVGFNQTDANTEVWDIKLQYAFVISSVLAVVTSIPFLVKSCKKIKSKEEHNLVPDEVWPVPPVHYVFSILLVMFMYICNTGIEDAFSAFLMTFVVEQLDWTKSQGALVSSTFWGALITMRVLVIFVADLLSPAKLILIAMSFLVTSLVGLLVCAQYFVHTGIWVFVCVAGGAISILFPTGISLTDQELVPVNGKVSSFILVAGAIGLLCNPVVLGFLIQEFSALYFCYLLLAEALFSIVLILMILLYGRTIVSKLRRRTVYEYSVSPRSSINEKMMDTTEPEGVPEGYETSSVREKMMDVTEPEVVPGGYKTEEIVLV
ncbi:hypothetical protein LOTGIDRAFT_237460 [Lottia gigantea]|uniref:Major facilitator superfamily (MFS) profile domain-containing protein n=1 Tax=Lottia gigantea TaxID=225164 RepID=V4B1P5_LOTGI|nr:hypothetical protein LOTGIDRAFT_237460 [Lottia gigantea]ESP04278.1 hypothetical protein LOTGIDRAFT_237460 [Lottia gigantea]